MAVRLVQIVYIFNPTANLDVHQIGNYEDLLTKLFFPNSVCDIGNLDDVASSYSGDSLLDLPHHDHPYFGLQK